MNFKLYFMALEVEPFSNRKHNVVMGSVMTLRASNQVLYNVIISFLWHDVIHWIIATSYDNYIFFISVHNIALIYIGRNWKRCDSLLNLAF